MRRTRSRRALQPVPCAARPLPAPTFPPAPRRRPGVSSPPSLTTAVSRWTRTSSTSKRTSTERPQALVARDFLLRGWPGSPRTRSESWNSLIVGAGISLLPRWARTKLRIPTLSLVDVALTPAARLLCIGLRWAVRHDREAQRAKAEAPVDHHDLAGHVRRVGEKRMPSTTSSAVAARPIGAASR